VVIPVPSNKNLKNINSLPKFLCPMKSTVRASMNQSIIGVIP